MSWQRSSLHPRSRPRVHGLIKYTAAAFFVCASSPGISGQQWQQPRSHEQLLPDSVDTWEPALAAAPNGHVYVVAGKRHGMPREDKDFEQQQVIWRSDDGGGTFDGPRPLTAEAMAVAPDGDVWLAVPSMSDSDIAQGRQTPVTLHVFRSGDQGRTWQDFQMSRSPRLPGACPHNPACPVKVPSITLAVDDRSRAHVLYTEGSTPQDPYGLFYQSSSDDGRTWSSRQVVSAAPRPQSADAADHHYIMMAASGEDRVCAVWVDDRRGALDVWARCSTDAGRTWGAETLLSDRADGTPYKSANGFKAFYGHYGGAAIDPSGRLHAVWGAGEPGYRTGGVWVNNVVSGGTRP